MSFFHKIGSFRELARVFLLFFFFFSSSMNKEQTTFHVKWRQRLESVHYYQNKNRQQEWTRGKENSGWRLQDNHSEHQEQMRAWTDSPFLETGVKPNCPEVVQLAKWQYTRLNVKEATMFVNNWIRMLNSQYSIFSSLVSSSPSSRVSFLTRPNTRASPSSRESFLARLLPRESEPSRVSFLANLNHRASPSSRIWTLARLLPRASQPSRVSFLARQPSRVPFLAVCPSRWR